jgi:hypothetical protein
MLQVWPISTLMPLESKRRQKTYCCYAYRSYCLTCYMYKSSLRHIRDPLLSLLKMKGIRLLLYKVLSIVSYWSVIVIYKSQYYSLHSPYETMASFLKKIPAELTLRCFQMFWEITVHTPLMSVLVMQHAPQNDELFRCLSPISIECAASSILFVAYKFHSRLLLPPHFKFFLSYVDVIPIWYGGERLHEF